MPSTVANGYKGASDMEFNLSRCRHERIMDTKCNLRRDGVAFPLDVCRYPAMLRTRNTFLEFPLECSEALGEFLKARLVRSAPGSVVDDADCPGACIADESDGETDTNLSSVASTCAFSPLRDSCSKISDTVASTVHDEGDESGSSQLWETDTAWSSVQGDVDQADVMYADGCLELRSFTVRTLFDDFNHEEMSGTSTLRLPPISSSQIPTFRTGLYARVLDMETCTPCSSGSTCDLATATTSSSMASRPAPAITSMSRNELPMFSESGTQCGTCNIVLLEHGCFCHACGEKVPLGNGGARKQQKQRQSMQQGVTWLNHQGLHAECGSPVEASTVEDRPERIRKLSGHRAVVRAGLQNPATVATQMAQTLGSHQHQMGKCRPCAFVWQPQGCQSGSHCRFCHICPPGEKKRRSKEKQLIVRAKREARALKRQHASVQSEVQ